MSDIRYFKLHNSGAFVAKMQIEWDGRTYEPSGYHDICVAAERTIDLADTKIPSDAEVRLKVDVVSGKNNRASEKYIYNPNSGATASYNISGTTLSNTLKLKSYK